MPGSLILPCFNIFKFFKTSFRFPASTHLRHRSESKNPSGWFLISQINFVNISWPLCSSEKIHNIKHGGYIIYMIRRVWTRKNFLLNFPPFCQLKEENQEGTVFIFVRKKCKKDFWLNLYPNLWTLEFPQEDALTIHPLSWFTNRGVL